MDDDAAICALLLLVAGVSKVKPLLLGGLVSVEDQVQHGLVKAKVHPMVEVMILMVLLVLIRGVPALVRVFVEPLELEEPVGHPGRRQPSVAHQQHILQQVEEVLRKTRAREDVGIPGRAVGQVVVDAMRVLVHNRQVAHSVNMIDHGLPAKEAVLDEVAHPGRDSQKGVSGNPSEADLTAPGDQQKQQHIAAAIEGAIDHVPRILANGAPLGSSVAARHQRVVAGHQEVKSHEEGNGRIADF